MNCILVDDERPALELLEDNVSRIPFLNIVASCRRPEQVFEVLENNRVDLIFLDINMPRINGLDLIKGIAKPPMVILVTAYPEHALDGFNLDVVDYLLKPIPFDRFLRAVNKAQRLHLAQSEKQLQSELDYFFVNANYSSIKIKKSDIICIEGLKDYVKIHLKEGKPIVTRLGLKGLDERLGN
ncbi:MAG: LytR/AlgR family response regulator transcription factor, partial [Bacteroidia bacterium]